jgi:hypothetical protein
LREEHRLRVFEKRVFRRIFETKREKDGSWRKLHNDELHNVLMAWRSLKHRDKSTLPYE